MKNTGGGHKHADVWGNDQLLLSGAVGMGQFGVG
jgi:hypothetical protein